MAYSKNKVNMEIEMLFGQESILIKKGEPLRLISASGFFAPSYEIGREDFSGNGGKITNKRYGMRELGITFGIADLPNTENIRSEVMRKLKAYKGCKVIAKRNGRIGTIECEIAGEPDISQTNYTRDRASISVPLIAEEPFFKSLAKREIDLEFGTTEITTYSDAPTGFEVGIVFTAEATNPKITGGNGEYIRIIGNFSAADRLLIISDGKNRGVLLNGEEYYQYDIKSRFFDLYPGEAEITISTDSGSGMDAKIRFYERYLGI